MGKTPNETPAARARRLAREKRRYEENKKDPKWLAREQERSRRRLLNGDHGWENWRQTHQEEVTLYQRGYARAVREVVNRHKDELSALISEFIETHDVEEVGETTVPEHTRKVYVVRSAG